MNATIASVFGEFAASSNWIAAVGLPQRGGRGVIAGPGPVLRIARNTYDMSGAIGASR